MHIDDWVPVEERMPKAEDADKEGCVIVWHAYQGAMITGWRRVAENRFISHWTHTPPAPADFNPEYRDR